MAYPDDKCGCGGSHSAALSYYNTGGGGGGGYTAQFEVSTGVYPAGGTWGTAGSPTIYTYPYTYWSTTYHVPKCQNCGYCSCCGKSDIPGKLTPEE